MEKFVAAELEVAARVLEAMAAADEAVLSAKPLRPIRRAALLVAKAASERMPPHVRAQYGMAPMDAAAMEAYRAREWRKSQARRDVDLDRKKANSAQLRAGRLASLQALRSSERALGLEAPLPRVPDGVGGEGADAPLPLAGAESEGEFGRPKACYTCKRRFRQRHPFYDRLCPECAELNWRKRGQTADLGGRVVLLTGCRVKIGFQSALKLLRCGAEVVGTSRFPHDAAARFAAEPDHADWQHRLHLYGLDFRLIPEVERFAAFVAARHGPINAIVNNACQTVRRPAAYFSPIAAAERAASAAAAPALPSLAGHAAWAAAGPTEMALEAEASPLAPAVAAVAPPGSAALSQTRVLPEDAGPHGGIVLGATDVNAQPVDLRHTNSWVLRMHQVHTAELCEVLAINAVAPFVLNARLKSSMAACPQPDRYIVNVSAMEGKFYRFKTAEHPHTNMAKASLNMMTRTSAQDYRESGIFMNCVDTGWINDENPADKAARIAAEHEFQTPIDEVDAAARVLDPIISGVGGGDRPYGKFFKDYAETEW